MGAESLLKSALAGRYEIEREIGSGGMATVYLARDVRHHRKVALKVLRPELGAVLGVERFLSEIRVTANLQHPNLLPLFDSGEAEGLLFYVMPYVEGEALRARLEREKQLPLDDAVRITVAVASALDYAHRHGVIHRDLKPENILLHEGQPLVADFGIALAVSNAGGNRITQTGLSLGTPHYMSPEQATGDRAIDARSDIYSLGAVCYEMLTGEPPHTGNTAQAVIARVLTEQPRSVRSVRPHIPEHVEQALESALEKLPADRWQTAAQFADALQGRAGAQPAGTSALPRSASAATRSRMTRVAPWIVAAVFATGMAGMAVAWWKLARVPAPAPVKFKLDFAQGRRLEDGIGHPVAISPDGRTIAYTGRGDQGRMIFVRHLGELEAKPLPGTAFAGDVEFSRDGRTLSFLGEGLRIRRVPANGGAATVVGGGAGWAGTSWGPDGDIVYAANRSLWRVASEGSEPTLLAAPDSVHGEFSLTNPYVLPDGSAVLFVVNTRDQSAEARFETVSLFGGDRRRLPIAGRNVVGVAGGILLYGSTDGSISAIRFDQRARAVRGQAVKVAEGVQVRNNYGGLSAALSDDGTLIYVRGQSAANLEVLDRTGRPVVQIPERQTFAGPAWSPDGSKIAVGSGGAFLLSSSVWIYDVASTVFSRLTTQRAGFRPSWTPDGKRVAFITGNSTVWWIPADGSGQEELFYELPNESLREVTFSPDGRFAALRTDSKPGRGTARDIYLLPLTGERKAIPLVQGAANELLPSISPNSRWLAYQSDETGRYEIYLRPLALVGGRLQISSGGGTEPRWTPDGAHVVYRGTNAFWSAALTFGANAVAVARRDSLFADPFGKYDISRQNYDISRDGRFVVVRDAAEGAEVIVVTNWLAEVRSKLRGK